MLWQIDLDPVSHAKFANLQLAEVLYDFGGPRIFTALCDSLLHLWYQCAEDDETGESRYLVVPTSEKNVAMLKDGSLTVHDALAQPWLWAVNLNAQNAPAAAWVLHGLSEVPADAKPRLGVPLWPHLRPLISYRLIGDGLAEGKIPASVIASAVKRPTAALKFLLELANNSASVQGRPEETFRKSYDLPVKWFAFNSFEVSFAAPAQEALEDLNQYIVPAAKLGEAFAWLSGDGAGHLDIELLEVLKALAPPASGQVTRSEVGGLLVSSNTKFSMTRDHRTLITQAIARHADQLLMRDFEGRVRQLDRDHFTLTLRDIDGQPDIKCSFSDEHFDDLHEAFNSEARTRIFGRLVQNGRILRILAVGPAAKGEMPTGETV